MRRTWPSALAVLAAVLLATLGGCETPPKEGDKVASDNIAERIGQAVAYLESARDESHRTALLYESPDGTRTVEGTSWQLRQTYWTQTDNFLAALALKPHKPALSQSLQSAIARYQIPSSSRPNAITVLDGRFISEDVRAARTIIEMSGEEHIILTEVQEGVDIPDWTQYGNLLALQSLNQWLRGNERNALRLYSMLIGKWDEHGIRDKATNADGQYAVYKIALALLLSKVYEDDLLEAVAMERMMWSAQAESGGIHTDIDAQTHAIGGYTNTETTSLVLLVYDEALIKSLRSKGLQAHQTAALGTPSDLRQITGAILSKAFNMSDHAEVDVLLCSFIDRARNHIASYLNRTFENEPVPSSVKEIVLRLASNLYNHALKVRQGPSVQAGEFEVQLTDDALFAQSLRQDLAPFRRTSVRILHP